MPARSSARARPPVTFALALLLVGLGLPSGDTLSAQPAAVRSSSSSATADTLRLRPGTERRRVAPQASITVSFDRPVLGQGRIERLPTVRLEPAVPVVVEWRDPSTLRVTPMEPLQPGRSYAVVVDTPLVASDGARLLAPAEVHIDVPLPVRRSSEPALRGAAIPRIDPRGRLRLYMSGAVDSVAWARAVEVRIDSTATCRAGTHAFVLTRQRPPASGEPVRDRFVRVIDGVRRDDTLTRVLEYEPATPLPEDCAGTLSLPDAREGPTSASRDRYRVHTAPPFRLQPLAPCRDLPCAQPGMIRVDFTSGVTPTLRAAVRADPRGPIADQSIVADPSGMGWTLPTMAQSRDTVRVHADSALRDVFGRALTGPRTWTVVVPDRTPAVRLTEHGLLLRPRGARASVQIAHVNAARVELRAVRLAPHAFAQLRPQPYEDLSGARDRWPTVGDTVREQHALASPRNAERVSTVPLPAAVLREPQHAWHIEVHLVRATSGLRLAGTPFSDSLPTSDHAPAAVLVRSDLAVHAHLLGAPSVVFVTHARSGAPIGSADVHLLDSAQRVIAAGRTAVDGTATLRIPMRETAWHAMRADARVLQVAVDGDTLRLPLQSIGSTVPVPLAGYKPRAEWAQTLWGAVPYRRAIAYTDRDLYRPGERLYIGAMLQAWSERGTHVLRGDSVRWIASASVAGNAYAAAPFDSGTMILSEAGTAADSLQLPADLGPSNIGVLLRRWSDGAWRDEARTFARIAEYRTPEFLVQVDSAPPSSERIGVARFDVTARYLHDAPLRGAPMRGDLRLDAHFPGLGVLPAARGDQVGPWDGTRHGVRTSRVPTRNESIDDTLDVMGRAAVTQPLPVGRYLGPVHAFVAITVTDVTGHEVTAERRAVIHPSAFYLAVRADRTHQVPGDSVRVTTRAITPEGSPVPNRRVRAALVRWRTTTAPLDWSDQVTIPLDTVWRSEMVTGDSTGTLAVPVQAVGVHELVLQSEDDAGRPVLTSVEVIGDTVPRRLIAARPPTTGHSWLRAPDEEVRHGEPAAVTIDSPFEDAEAWLTLDREGTVWQWRARVSRGTHTVSVPTADVRPPGAYLSLLLVPRADPLDRAHPQLQSSDAEPALARWHFASVALRVGERDRRLSIDVAPARPTWAPGDTATITIRVRDTDGAGAPSRVTVWAVDEGQLSLGAYRAPDPHAHFAGMPNATMPALSSLFFSGRNADSAAVFAALRRPWFLEGDQPDFSGRGVRAESARGGVASYSVMDSPGANSPSPEVRDDFRTTAFFIADIATDSTGHAVARAALPHGVTRYRVFAVAGDTRGRTGRDSSQVQVTAPFVMRVAFPRFVRPADRFEAGGALSPIDDAVRTVTVAAEGRGLVTRDAPRTETAGGRARSVRFAWTVPETAPATASVLLRATSSDARDVVRTSLPVRRADRSHVLTRGLTLRGVDTVALTLPPDARLEGAELSVQVGGGARAALGLAAASAQRASTDALEPIASQLRVLVAMSLTDADSAWRRDAARLVRQVTSRVSGDGSVRYWASSAWTTPWLTAYAGLALLEAADAGVAVDTVAVRRIALWLSRATIDTTLFAYGTRPERAVREARALAQELAVAQLLRGSGTPDTTREHALLDRADAMAWEDVPWLADLLMAAGRAPEAAAMLERAWRLVGTDGAALQFPAARTGADVPSLLRGPARLLAATARIRATHPQLPALVTHLATSLAGGASTQDAAWSASALAPLARVDTSPAVHRLALMRVDGSRRLDTVVVESSSSLAAANAPRLELTVPADRHGSTQRRAGDSVRIAVRVEVEAPAFASFTLRAAPSRPRALVRSAGLQVERWIERVADNAPVTTLEASELVRVVLRVRTAEARDFVVLEDALPAGLEPVDPSLRSVVPTVDLRRSMGTLSPPDDALDDVVDLVAGERGMLWPVWMHRELRDDVVRFHARALWPGVHTVSYLARATTSGQFVHPAAHAFTQFDRGVTGRTAEGLLEIRAVPDKEE
jgi:uncharacterized protein YfaS (alpha-2-macroglobulin family)